MLEMNPSQCGCQRHELINASVSGEELIYQGNNCSGSEYLSLTNATPVNHGPF